MTEATEATQTDVRIVGPQEAMDQRYVKVEDLPSLPIDKDTIIRLLSGSNPCDIYDFSDYSSEISDCIDIDHITEQVQERIDIDYEVERAVDNHLCDYNPLENCDLTDEVISNMSIEAVPDCWWPAIIEELLTHDEFIQGIMVRTSELMCREDKFEKIAGYVLMESEGKDAVEYLVRSIRRGMSPSRSSTALRNRHYGQDEDQAFLSNKEWDSNKQHQDALTLNTRFPLRWNGWCPTCGNSVADKKTAVFCSPNCAMLGGEVLTLRHAEAIDMNIMIEQAKGNG